MIYNGLGEKSGYLPRLWFRLPKTSDFQSSHFRLFSFMLFSCLFFRQICLLCKYPSDVTWKMFFGYFIPVFGVSEGVSLKFYLWNQDIYTLFFHKALSINILLWFLSKYWQSTIWNRLTIVIWYSVIPDNYLFLYDNSK